jgi:CHASE2 domain-containing sensor protein
MAVSCGLVLLKTSLGAPWENASYDYLFRFGARSVSNQVVVILMDNASYAEFKQDATRLQPWDRGLHTDLLNRLADDGCALVVFDSFFRLPRDPAKDQALAEAIKRQRQIVLMAEQAAVNHPEAEGAYPIYPLPLFLDAAKGHYGVAWLDPGLDLIVRKHWPFPAPGHYPSLPRAAAELAGAQLNTEPREQWLRYYRNDTLTTLSYRFWSAYPTNSFRDRIVFIGTQPRTTVIDDEKDEFRSPHSRWTGESTPGVKIMATSFLNLMNHDWLERPAPWIEKLVLVISGILLGGFLCRMFPMTACATAAGVMVIVALGAIAWSYFTNYWFPWLIIVGAQVPVALVWAILMPAFHRVHQTITVADTIRKAPGKSAHARAKSRSAEPKPEVSDYQLIDPPFGEGAYGKVWLARNAVGQWQALKVVYLKNFNNNSEPYEREFNGISRYKRISDKHPGLLRVDFVSRKREDYFYYVMELGDAVEPGWEQNPSSYRPRDLGNERNRLPSKRLPVPECVRIGLELTEALEFLHSQGLTHRDIKPQNIIFVNGRPRLADVGLIADIRPPDQERTFVGTPGYMPPPPEQPGTPQADIYALGMVLYVLSTGRNTGYFPEISTTLVANPSPVDFLPLNKVILKACHPDSKLRYQSAGEMREALFEAQQALDKQAAGKPS